MVVEHPPKITITANMIRILICWFSWFEAKRIGESQTALAGANVDELEQLVAVTYTTLFADFITVWTNLV